MTSKVYRVLLLTYLFARPGIANGDQMGPSALYGTWRWVDTVGDLLPARGTPHSCNCARLLILVPKGSYHYFWTDSSERLKGRRRIASPSGHLRRCPGRMRIRPFPSRGMNQPARGGSKAIPAMATS